MEPSIVAIFGLIAVGLIVVLVGAYKLTRPAPKFWQVAISFVFGILMLGISAFGMQFMTSFGEFIGKILPLINSPGGESYASAIDAIGSGKLSAQNAGTAKAIMMENPTSDLESLIEQRSIKATDPDGKAILSGMLNDLRAKKQLAVALADNAVQGEKVDTQKIAALDVGTQRFVAQEIARRPQIFEKLAKPEKTSIENFAKPGFMRKKQ